MPVQERRFELPGAVDLHRTLAPVRRGASDPTTWIRPDGVWRATRTPGGAATIRLGVVGGQVRAQAWGPGAAWALDTAPALLGAGDDAAGFEPLHPVVARLARRFPGLRIARTGLVTEALVPTVLEQKVVGLEARRSYRSLVRTLGEPAPGPAGKAGLLLPPSPARLAATPSYAFHPFGVERRRADTIRAACGRATRIEEFAALAPGDAQRRLCALPGIGPWSAAEIASVALGDADAVPVGDYHLPHQVAWALAGEARADDARMLELLEPYRGHRGRVLRLLAAGGIAAPRFGPRMPLRAIARI